MKKTATFTAISAAMLFGASAQVLAKGAQVCATYKMDGNAVECSWKGGDKIVSITGYDSRLGQKTISLTEAKSSPVSCYPATFANVDSSKPSGNPFEGETSEPDELNCTVQ